MGRIVRCGWSEGNELLRRYHDEEWGVPVHEDTRMFEYLFLEAMQCGLSWNLMLERREAFRRSFDGFDFERIAEYDERRANEILEAPGMIRSRRKIAAEISNARAALQLKREYGTLCEYFWRWTDGKSLVYRAHDAGFPAENALSRRIAADLKSRGFKYLGPVTVYAHLQSCGIINDHERSCFRFQALCDRFPTAYVEDGQ